MRIYLPNLYLTLKGKEKKLFAWTYLKKYHPECVPAAEQPGLEDENYLICTFDYEAARKSLSQLNSRRADRKSKKTRR